MLRFYFASRSNIFSEYNILHTDTWCILFKLFYTCVFWCDAVVCVCVYAFSDFDLLSFWYLLNVFCWLWLFFFRFRFLFLFPFTHSFIRSFILFSLHRSTLSKCYVFLSNSHFGGFIRVRILLFSHSISIFVAECFSRWHFLRF